MQKADDDCGGRRGRTSDRRRLRPQGHNPRGRVVVFRRQILAVATATAAGPSQCYLTRPLARCLAAAAAAAAAQVMLFKVTKESTAARWGVPEATDFPPGIISYLAGPLDK